MTGQNFTAQIHFEGKPLHVAVLPKMRPDGMHYEVNVPGFPRFFMRWGVADRFEAVGSAAREIPDSLMLAVSDAIEERVRM
jgi:hypothetical protein